MAVVNVVKLSELERTKRIDAEYYQPKYFEIDKILEKAKLTLDHITDCVVGFAFPSEDLIPNEGMPVIKMNNLTPGPFVNLEEFEGITDINRYGNISKYIIKKYDILVGLTGSLGSVALYLQDRPAYLNQRILRVRSLKIKPSALLAILRSDIFRKYLERVSLGGVQPNVRPEDAKKFPIIEFSSSATKEFEDLMKKVMENTVITKHLLEEAKRKVEQAIEKELK